VGEAAKRSRLPFDRRLAAANRRKDRSPLVQVCAAIRIINLSFHLALAPGIFCYDDRGKMGKKGRYYLLQVPRQGP
jgi:hypothetical protein